MRIKGLIDEDFINYKKISMFISTCFCDWKCCDEQGLDKSICQNSELALSPIIEISADDLFRRYISNPLSKAIVIGGLEPIKQFEEVYSLIHTFRSNGCYDDFVIYTGYTETEIKKEINILKDSFTNIIIKFGRYVPNRKSHYDEVLGVNLVSGNQKGVQVC